HRQVEAAELHQAHREIVGGAAQQEARAEAGLASAGGVASERVRGHVVGGLGAVSERLGREHADGVLPPRAIGARAPAVGSRFAAGHGQYLMVLTGGTGAQDLRPPFLGPPRGCVVGVVDVHFSSVPPARSHLATHPELNGEVHSSTLRPTSFIVGRTMKQPCNTYYTRVIRFFLAYDARITSLN